MTGRFASWKDGRRLAWAAAAMLAASILLGILVPIYTDEIGWRFQARFALDGVDRFLAEQCGANTLAVPPLFMWPMRWGQALLDTVFPDPLFVRLTGMIVAAAVVALLWRLIGSIARVPEQSAWLRALALGLFGLGVFPWLLIWSRPEQSLLLFLLGALLVSAPFWRDGGKHADARGTWLRSIAILVLAVAALSIHLKGVVLAPLFALAILFAGRGPGSAVPRIASGAALVAATVSALGYWTARFACPGDSLVAGRLRDQSIAASFTGPGSLLEKLGAIDLSQLSPVRYWRRTIPSMTYNSDWLPSNLVEPHLLAAWRPVLDGAWILAFAMLLSMAVMAMVVAIRSRRLEPRTAIGLALLGVALLWSFTQVYKSGYDAMFVLPMLVLALLLLSQQMPARRWGPRVVPVAGAAAAVLAVLSQALLFATHVPALAEVAGYPGALERQRFSFSAFGYPRNEIAAAGAQCGASPESRVMIDDITYFPYLHADRPLHRLGVIEEWNGSVRDPLAYLRGKGVRAMVTACDYLPDGLRAQAKRSGRFCCVGPLN